MTALDFRDLSLVSQVHAMALDERVQTIRFRDPQGAAFLASGRDAAVDLAITYAEHAAALETGRAE